MLLHEHFITFERSTTDNTTKMKTAWFKLRIEVLIPNSIRLGFNLRWSTRGDTFCRRRAKQRFRNISGSIWVNNRCNNLLGSVRIYNFGRGGGVARFRDPIHGDGHWRQRLCSMNKNLQGRAIRRRRAATAFRSANDTIIGTDRYIDILFVKRTRMDTTALIKECNVEML